jgi:hypothetical protein
MHNSPALAALTFAIVIVLLTPGILQAQYAISTIAGGGPNNLAELNAAIGYAGSVVLDAAGNTYIADSYSNHIFKVDTTGNLTIVAGNGSRGYSGDGGPATSAALNGPEGVFVDASGNIFIADTDNSVIREVTASNGNIATVAGNGNAGYSGDGGPATSAQLYDPYGVFVDSAENIYIADTDNCLIREVSAGAITTVAGNPTLQMPCGYAGDGGPAISAQLDGPQGLFVDSSGNIFIADTDNCFIRKVSAGNIATVAGDPTAQTPCGYSGDNGPATAAQLDDPGGVFVDGSGNIFIADTDNCLIRKVSAGDISSVAGNPTQPPSCGYAGDGAAATSAWLNYPSNIFVDSAGDIFIADTNNFAIREVNASTLNIQTNIGDKTLAYSLDPALALDAELNAPASVFVDGSGNVFIADSDNSVIREVVATTGDMQTVAGNAILGAGYSGDGGLATSAQLNHPEGVFVDRAGSIFIADTKNCLIREVSAGNITTVAGSSTPQPTCGYSGDNGPATSAQLSDPFGVFVDSSENIYIADTDNSAIREVAASSQNITTVAGTGTACAPDTATCGDGGPAISAQLSSPTAVFVDPAGDIFIADTFDNRIREVTTSNLNINTVAGTGERGYSGDGAAATSALLDTPYGVFVDASGNIFISDSDNFVIREVAAATGNISTIAGNGTAGFSGDGGQSTSAELNSPAGLFGNSAGNLFVADTDNFRIRKLVPGIFVTVTPNPVNVAITTQQQFTAAVTGTTNTSVTWQVNGVAGGNASVGTISATGLFQAPAAIPTPATVTVSATASDNTTSGSAQATIVGPGGAVNVTVNTSPAITQVYTGTVQAFIATVTGTTNTAVTWQVNGVSGGNAAFGTIDTSGNYTAPANVPSPAAVSIEAVSQALSTAIGSESVTIVTAPSAAQPTPQTVSPGGTATYSLLLNENTGAPAQPITLSCRQSSLPPNAACAFTPPKITPGPQAVSFTLTITVPTGSASLEKPQGMHLQLCFAFVPLAGILLAGAGRPNKKRYWLGVAALCVLMILLNACGGASNSTPANPELGTYNVKVQGTTLAQPNPVTITTVGLMVQ